MISSKQTLQGILRALEHDDINAVRYILASFHEEARDELKALLRPVETQPVASNPKVMEGELREYARQLVSFQEQNKTQADEIERLRTVLRQLAHKAGEELGGFHSIVTFAEEAIEGTSHETVRADTEDMANIGRALMARLPKGYHWNDCPTEIVTDLQNEIHDLKRAAAETAEARVENLTPEQKRESVQAMYDDLVGGNSGD
jgi:tRNA C32,U32 (ribose-2'-O)-methylase TrmJ